MESSRGLTRVCNLLRHGAVRLFGGAALACRTSMKRDPLRSDVIVELVNEKSPAVLVPPTAPHLMADVNVQGA